MKEARVRAPTSHSATPAGRPLEGLLSQVTGILDHPGSEHRLIRGIASDSHSVEPGFVFVAIEGSNADGHDFVGDAVDRGAAAVVVERPPQEGLSVPVVRVDDSRRVLAELAAAWHDHPADALTLVGITGTVGKTSVLTMLEAILLAADIHVGAVGSLGVQIEGTTTEETGFTAPDALLLHEKLALLRDAGCTMVVMEATSHALAQKRLHGLRYGLGVFTNLVPLEHQDYHGSFEEYVKVKESFFDYLEPGAPVVYNADDPVVSARVLDRAIRPIGCGRAEGAEARIHDMRMTAAGSELTLELPAAPRAGKSAGETKEPLRVDLRLRLLGRANVTNAALAATTAHLLDVPPSVIADVLDDFPPARRRMEIVHDEEFMVLDDTVGHPESISALFEAVEQLNPRRIHVVFAIRGQRGAEINWHTAQALAICTERAPVASLIVTRADEVSDQRNRADDSEHDAFVGALRGAGQLPEERRELRDAVSLALDRAGPGDLVLLLGAQGMDAGAEYLREWTRKHRLRSAR
jgi:UDP-N-acetylmuramoyl-L-alanyl-D-glutamate--2,6-diaminopimelate ligase